MRLVLSQPEGFSTTLSPLPTGRRRLSGAYSLPNVVLGRLLATKGQHLRPYLGDHVDATPPADDAKWTVYHRSVNTQDGTSTSEAGSQLYHELPPCLLRIQQLNNGRDTELGHGRQTRRPKASGTE